MECREEYEFVFDEKNSYHTEKDTIDWELQSQPLVEYFEQKRELELIQVCLKKKKNS